MQNQLDFHLPRDFGKEVFVKLHDDPNKRYFQLVCWCLVQRYWYYILGDSQVSDLEYDEIEREVRALEDVITYPKNKYSPISNSGSDLMGLYPMSILIFFSEEFHGKGKRK